MICPKCNAEFTPKRPSYPPKYCPSCTKIVSRERSRKWAVANRNHVNEYKRQWTREWVQDPANRERKRAASHRWYGARGAEYHRGWRERNPENVKENLRRYRERHPEMVAKHNRKRLERLAAQLKELRELQQQQPLLAKARKLLRGRDKNEAERSFARQLKTSNPKLSLTQIAIKMKVQFGRKFSKSQAAYYLNN